MRATVTDLIHLLLALPLHLVLLALAGAWWAWRAGRGQPLYRWRWPLLAVAAWAYGASMPLTANSLIAWLESRHPAPVLAARPGPPPTVLVLSGGWFRPLQGGGYQVMLTRADRARIDAAVDLHRRLGARLIFSGAPLPDGSDSVAQQMAAQALRLGVPAAQLAVETRSVNTHQNLLFSRQQFALDGVAPVLLVTSALHMPRAVAVAQRLGLAVQPVPCDFRAEPALRKWQLWLPSNDGAAALEEVLHELLGLWAYRLSGRA